MAKGTTPGREQIIRRMWKLANAGVEDAVKLACFPTEEWGGVEGMNLDALTEFKRGSNGVVELKFTDRARLLERQRGGPGGPLFKRHGAPGRGEVRDEWSFRPSSAGC